MRKRVLVTGTGAIAAPGRSAAAIYEAAAGGRSGIARIRRWDPAGWAWPMAGEVEEGDPRSLVADRKLHKLLSRSDMLGLYAAQEALKDSGVLAARDSLPEADRAAFNERTAVVAASGGECYQNQYDYFPLLDRSGGDLERFGAELSSTVSPMWLLKTLPNNVLCYAGTMSGFKGPNANFTSHSAGGVLAVLEAARMLSDGEADRALVVGYDAPVEPQAFLYFAALGILARTAIRSFDAAREGSILGEGAAALFLESEESAAVRGARARGEVLGGAVVSEGEGLLRIREDGDGVARAARLAFEDAGVSPAEAALVVAHANGTHSSDLSEGLALRELFGAAGPPVTGFKWAVGHLIAGSGVLEAAVALEALSAGTAPGIATLERLDPELEGLRALRAPASISEGPALLVSRGFGGICGALVLARGGPA